MQIQAQMLEDRMHFMQNVGLAAVPSVSVSNEQGKAADDSEEIVARGWPRSVPPRSRHRPFDCG